MDGDKILTKVHFQFDPVVGNLATVTQHAYIYTHMLPVPLLLDNVRHTHNNT